MRTVENGYRQVCLQADAINASLQDLINANRIDLKKALDDHKTKVTRMQTPGKQLDNYTADMSAQGQSHFSAGDKQGNTYTNPRFDSSVRSAAGNCLTSLPRCCRPASA